MTGDVNCIRHTESKYDLQPIAYKSNIEYQSQTTNKVKMSEMSEPDFLTPLDPATNELAKSHGKLLRLQKKVHELDVKIYDMRKQLKEKEEKEEGGRRSFKKMMKKLDEEKGEGEPLKKIIERLWKKPEDTPAITKLVCDRDELELMIKKLQEEIKTETTMMVQFELDPNSDEFDVRLANSVSKLSSNYVEKFKQYSTEIQESYQKIMANDSVAKSLQLYEEFCNRIALPDEIKRDYLKLVKLLKQHPIPTLIVPRAEKLLEICDSWKGTAMPGVCYPLFFVKGLDAFEDYLITPDEGANVLNMLRGDGAQICSFCPQWNRLSFEFVEVWSDPEVEFLLRKYGNMEELRNVWARRTGMRMHQFDPNQNETHTQESAMKLYEKESLAQWNHHARRLREKNIRDVILYMLMAISRDQSARCIEARASKLARTGSGSHGNYHGNYDDLHAAAEKFPHNYLNLFQYDCVVKRVKNFVDPCESRDEASEVFFPPYGT